MGMVHQRSTHRADYEYAAPPVEFDIAIDYDYDYATFGAGQPDAYIPPPTPTPEVQQPGDIIPDLPPPGPGSDPSDSGPGDSGSDDPPDPSGQTIIPETPPDDSGRALVRPLLLCLVHDDVFTQAGDVPSHASCVPHALSLRDSQLAHQSCSIDSCHPAGP